MNASRFSGLVLADETAALIFGHVSSPTVECRLLQVRRPRVVENYQILLLSCNNAVTKIQAFRRGLQHLHPYQSFSQPIDCASGLSKASQQLLFPFRAETSKADPTNLVNRKKAEDRPQLCFAAVVV